jgi:hypothetical protein
MSEQTVTSRGEAKPFNPMFGHAPNPEPVEVQEAQEDHADPKDTRTDEQKQRDIDLKRGADERAAAAKEKLEADAKAKKEVKKGCSHDFIEALINVLQYNTPSNAERNELIARLREFAEE